MRSAGDCSGGSNPSLSVSYSRRFVTPWFTGCYEASFYWHGQLCQKLCQNRPPAARFKRRIGKESVVLDLVFTVYFFFISRIFNPLRASSNVLSGLTVATSQDCHPDSFLRSNQRMPVGLDNCGTAVLNGHQHHLVHSSSSSGSNVPLVNAIRPICCWASLLFRW